MRIAIPLILLLLAAPANAMVGGAPPASATYRSAVLIVGSRGNSCTGVAIARDLVLSVAHCVGPGAEYKLVEFDAQRRPKLRDVERVVAHPQFSLATMLKHRATADVALLKLRKPLPASIATATLAAPTVRPGDRLAVAGYGVTVRGDGRTGGTLREAQLVVTGRPGNLQIRLHDPATKGERAGLGACTGDSGAPVFATRDGNAAVIGLVSWSTGPRGSDGCGGLTGVTPLALYRDWIAKAAKELGSTLSR